MVGEVVVATETVGHVVLFPWEPLGGQTTVVVDHEVGDGAGDGHVAFVGVVCWEVGFSEPTGGGCAVCLEEDAGEGLCGVVVVFDENGDVGGKEFETVQGQAAP